MEYYTVKDVAEGREWSTPKSGPMMSYDIVVTDNEGLEISCYTNRKASSNAPIEGERIFGFIDNDKNGNQKLTKAQDPNYQGGQQRSYNSSSTPSKPSHSQQDSSDRDLQIIRQSSLKAAVEVCIANMVPDGVVSESDVLTMADRFTVWAHTGKRSGDVHPDEVNF